MSRVVDEKISISSRSTAKFFENRAERFNPDHPLTATSYQDMHPEIAAARDIAERSKVLPLLALTGHERVMDIGCGTGRWLSAIHDRISFGWGIDASKGLIDLARKLCPFDNVLFSVSDIGSFENKIFEEKEKFDRFIISGVLVYLNDEQVENIFAYIEKNISDNGIVYIREPVGIEKRLSLKDFWSDELNDYYSAIYRTSDEISDMINIFFPQDKFHISGFESIFEEGSLNNRSETVQKFCLVARHGVLGM